MPDVQWDYDADEWGPANNFRDGRIHVCSEMCSTCIFRPGNLMRLTSGRVRQMVDDAKRDESCITCHATLGTDANAICRGFFDRFKTQPLQIAERLGLIEEVPPPKKEVPSDTPDVAR